MPTYYVAMLARYVLVDAASVEQARRLGTAALRDTTGSTPVNIVTVRPATDDEIWFDRWHREMSDRERTHNPEQGDQL